MMCSGYVNLARLNVRLDGELLDEVDCFLYLESQVPADGGCEMNVLQ